MLSKEWNNRDRRQKSQLLALKLSECHDTLGHWGKEVDIMPTIRDGVKNVGVDGDFSHPEQGPN